MQKTTGFIMSLMALLLLAGGIFLSLLNAAPAAAAASGMALPHPTRQFSTAMGVPALPVTSMTGVITIQAVQQFVTSHPFIGGPIVAGSSVYPTTVSVLETTSGKIAVLTHGESTGLPSNALVYYVTLHGPFRLLNASGLTGAKTPVCQTGIEVFDAQTGNLLLWGAF